MVNEDLVGGLQSALSRGESLQQAMMSFYNAGYKKEDIEWAAKSLQMQTPVQRPLQQPISQTKAPTQNKVAPQLQNSKPPKTLQAVSDYAQKTKSRKRLIMLIAILLIILLGGLAGIILFSEEILQLIAKS